MPAHNPPAIAAATTATRHMQERRKRVERRADPHRGDRADDVLPLPADVEQPAAECERDGQSCEDEHRELDECLLEIARGDAWIGARLPGEEPVEPRSVEDRPVGGERILSADHEHDQAAYEEREEQGQKRDRNGAGATAERDTARERLGRRAVAGGLGCAGCRDRRSGHAAVSSER